jgi:hypothetical protein
MSSITLNLSQFALGLGNADRLTLEASVPFHKAYHKADAEGQAAMQLEFVTSYVQGKLKSTPEKAAKIVALKRVERSAKDELAVNAITSFGKSAALVLRLTCSKPPCPHTQS